MKALLHTWHLLFTMDPLLGCSVSPALDHGLHPLHPESIRLQATRELRVPQRGAQRRLHLRLQTDYSLTASLHVGFVSPETRPKISCVFLYFLISFQKPRSHNPEKPVTKRKLITLFCLGQWGATPAAYENHLGPHAAHLHSLN